MRYKFFIGVILLTLSMIIIPVHQEKITAAQSIELRGVIEGFYGRPWSNEQRLENLDFMGQQGLNMYIYAPKDDIYHREKWREPYSDVDKARLAELIQAAKRNNVEFVFALSPGIDINLTGDAFESDVAALVNKFSTMYDLGVRQFAIFFDDIEMKNGAVQATVINRVNKALKSKYDDLKPLLTVPTEYFTADMFEGTAVKEYTQEFASSLDSDVIVMYTGEGVVCEGISKADITKVKTVYGRKMAVWWNYPVSDYMPEKLALGPIVGMESGIKKHIRAFIINPMENSRLSRITMQTGAAYAKNPSGYVPDEAWQTAIREQYGDLAADMMLFADHSQRMENSWAHTGRTDGAKLRLKMDEFWKLAANGQNIDEVADSLDSEFNRLEVAADRLQRGLPTDILSECTQQLALFKALAVADKTALQAVKAKLNGQNIAQMRYRQELLQQIDDLAKYKATLSEQTMRAFLDEAVKFISVGDLVTE